MKNPPEEKLLIALTANRINQACSIIKTTPPDYPWLLQLAAKHKLHGIVAQRLLDLAKICDVDLPKADIKASLQLAVALNLQLKAGFLSIKEILKKLQVDFLLIKGFALDSSPLRAMNDIDILIQENDLKQVFKAMTTAGCTYVGSGVMSKKEFADPFSTLHWNNQFQFITPRTSTHVEIHTALFERDRIRLERLDRFLDRVDLFRAGCRYSADLDCNVPSPEANLALLCIHSTTKRSPAHNTYILRHALDLWSLLEEGIDMNRFINLCREWDIGYYACTAFRLSAIALTLPEIESMAAQLEPLLNKRERLLSQLHLNCYRGPGDAPFLRRKIFALFMPLAIAGGLKKGLSWYRKLLFPPVWYQEERYGITRNSPFFFLSYIYGPFVFIWRSLWGEKRI